MHYRVRRTQQSNDYWVQSIHVITHQVKKRFMYGRRLNHTVRYLSRGATANWRARYSDSLGGDLRGGSSERCILPTSFFFV